VNRSGFSLVELMFIILIFSILSSWGFPKLSHTLDRHNIKMVSMEIKSFFTLGKISALQKQAYMNICPSTNLENCDQQWGEALLLYHDENRNNQRDPNEQLIQVLHLNQHIRFVTARNYQIKFRPNGWSTASANSIFVCGKSASATGRRLVISRSGMMRIEKPNANGGWRKSSGIVVKCHA
jgi:type IV fimbrial biogenesis protein FimT